MRTRTPGVGVLGAIEESGNLQIMVLAFSVPGCNCTKTTISQLALVWRRFSCLYLA